MVYKNRLKDAAPTILEGRSTTANIDAHVSIFNFFNYRSSILLSSPHPDVDRVHSVFTENVNLISAISSFEVPMGLKELNGKAAGVDRV